VIVRLADANILRPLPPHRPERSFEALATPSKPVETSLIGRRAMIVDRNNQTLAVSMPTHTLVADPRLIIDPADIAHKLKQILPRLDEHMAVQRLSQSNRFFVY